MKTNEINNLYVSLFTVFQSAQQANEQVPQTVRID